MNNPFLIGDTVYLRALERSDAPVVTPWFNDPEVIRFTLRYRPINVPAEERFIEQMSQSEHAGVRELARDDAKRKRYGAVCGVQAGTQSCTGACSAPIKPARSTRPAGALSHFWWPGQQVQATLRKEPS